MRKNYAIPIVMILLCLASLGITQIQLDLVAPTVLPLVAKNRAYDNAPAIESYIVAGKTLPPGVYYTSTTIDIFQSGGVLRGNGGSTGWETSRYVLSEKGGANCTVIIYIGPAADPAILVKSIMSTIDDIQLQREDFDDDVQWPADNSVGIRFMKDWSRPSGLTYIPHISLVSWDTAIQLGVDNSNASEANHVVGGLWEIDQCRTVVRCNHAQANALNVQHIHIGDGNEIVLDYERGGKFTIHSLYTNSPNSLICRMANLSENYSYGWIDQLFVDNNADGWRLFDADDASAGTFYFHCGGHVQDGATTAAAEDFVQFVDGPNPQVLDITIWDPSGTLPTIPTP